MVTGEERDQGKLWGEALFDKGLEDWEKWGMSILEYSNSPMNFL